jgi:hypothetical protein
MKSGDVVIVAPQEGLTEGQSVTDERAEEPRGVLLDRVTGAHFPLRLQDADASRRASGEMIAYRRAIQETSSFLNIMRNSCPDIGRMMQMDYGFMFREALINSFRMRSWMPFDCTRSALLAVGEVPLAAIPPLVYRPWSLPPFRVVRRMPKSIFRRSGCNGGYDTSGAQM